MFFAGDVAGFDSGGRSPYDDFWYGPTPARTPAGVMLNPDTAMRLATFYACVNVITQDIAKVPLVLYRRKEDGSRERVTDHPVVKLLANPSKWMTPIDWKQRLQGQQLMRGNAYCEKRYDFRGRWTELNPLKVDNVRVEQLPDGTVRYHYTDPQTFRERVYLQGEILHFRGLSLEGPLGMSLIDQMRDSLGEAVAAQNYGASFFGNDARPSLILEHPAHFKDEGTRKEWLRAFKQAYGAANRFSPMMLEYGIKIANLPPLSHADLQFLELRKLKATEICAMTRVPPHKVGILDRSTNNNIEHQGIEYVTDCLLSWVRRWEERMAIELLDDSEREEYYFEFLLDMLMRGDTDSRYKAYQSGIQAGWLTRNEVRKRENLDDLDGLDEPLEPVNMVPAGSQPATEIPDGAVPSKGAPGEDPQDPEGRARQLEIHARRRVLNRETRALGKFAQSGTNVLMEQAVAFYADHAAFVGEALAVSPAVADAYCERQFDDLLRASKDGTHAELLAQWRADADALRFFPLPSPKEE